MTAKNITLTNIHQWTKVVHGKGGHKGSPALKNFKTEVYGGKVMLTVVWNVKGVVHTDSCLVTPSVTVGGTRIHWQSCKDNSKSLSSHGVASPSVWECLTMCKCKNYCRDWNLGFTVFYHPPHSPDMAMSDFHFFPKPKEHLRAHYHMLDDETKTLVKLHSSIIKMHNSNMRDLQSTWTMEKVCKPWRWLCGEITV